ncbi:MAG TPA: hypothetical protein VFH57_02620 [Gammaproteobacteria bacterium]|nr:hypothetical protein [Gammaproteobacteria bacterium]
MATALAAIVAGGLVAAAIAHDSSRHVVWMVAYLVLVVGVAQAVLGLGQALLPARLPSLRWRVGEWALFNAGNAGVIAGTLVARSVPVVIGTALFVIALLLFLTGLNNAGRGWPLQVYRAVLAVACIGAITGLALSLIGISR